jgi:hypothetical protein
MQTSPVRTIGELAATVFTGLVLAKLKKPSGSTLVRILQARDVKARLAPPDELQEFAVPETSDLDRYRLRTSDIVVTARGVEVRAAVAPPAHDGIVVGPNLIVIRPGPEITPELMAILLRHPITQRSLLSGRTGSNTAGFTVRELKNIKIAVPEAAVQHRLVEITEVAMAYHSAALKAAELRREVAGDLVLQTLRA